MAKVLIPLAEGFEDSEFSVPMERLRKAGHEVTVVGSRAGEMVVGKRGHARARVDTDPSGLDPADFDALVIPGGHAPDRLRRDEAVVDLVKGFYRSGRPVAAICHGPHLLVEADVVVGRTLTSWPSLGTDIENAGGSWIDHELVEDENLITSRKPEDLEMFCQAILDRI